MTSVNTGYRTRHVETGNTSPIGPRAISENNRVFYQVSGSINREKMAIVSEIFHRILRPLYGPQDKAIEQIRESKDRRCFLLYEGEIPLGVLVFKTVLSNEFKSLGIEDSIEVKSLFVDNSHENSGKGLGSDLVIKLKAESEALGLNHRGIHVTVSETKVDSLAFFQKKGFKIVHAWDERYKKGTTEFLLSCPTRIAADSEELVRNIAEDLSKASLQGRVLLFVIEDAHHNDIHVLKSLSNGTFISGSKDNCLYQWDENGQLIRIVDEVEPNLQSDGDWVTAAAKINDAFWVSGKRNGTVTLWKSNGQRVKDLSIDFARKRVEHFSQRLNQRRPNCLAAGLDPSNPTVFVGFPTEFEEYSLIEGRAVASTVVHKNDWVFCIHPFAIDTLFTVVGGGIEAWKKNHEKWEHTATILREPAKIRGVTRAFIPAFKEIDHDNGLFALSDFWGSVKLLDVGQKKVVREWKEHGQEDNEKHVWSVEKLTNFTFASSGADRAIKIWDVRQQNSVRTINDSPAGVNTLLNLKEHLLVAGTSLAPMVARGVNRAGIRFYDLRN